MWEFAAIFNGHGRSPFSWNKFGDFNAFLRGNHKDQQKRCRREGFIAMDAECRAVNGYLINWRRRAYSGGRCSWGSTPRESPWQNQQSAIAAIKCNFLYLKMSTGPAVGTPDVAALTEVGRDK